jgi:hypothetical protein
LSQPARKSPPNQTLNRYATNRKVIIFNKQNKNSQSAESAR